jgi:hypothetical protein
MEADTISVVAVLRDAPSPLLRTKLIDAVDTIRTSETLYQVPKSALRPPCADRFHGIDPPAIAGPFVRPPRAPRHPSGACSASLAGPQTVRSPGAPMAIGFTHDKVTF